MSLGVSDSRQQGKGVGVVETSEMTVKSDNYTVKEYRNKRSVWTNYYKTISGSTFHSDTA